jgi:hypothetical protein
VIRSLQKSLRSVHKSSSPKGAVLQRKLCIIQQLPSIPLFRFTALLRPSNLQQLRDLVDDDAQWSVIVTCSKAVFDSVKESIPEWISDQRRLSEIEQPGPMQRPRFSRTEEVRGATSTSPTRKGEWDQYLELIVSARNDADLKQWWNLHRREFSVCYSLPQAYLCVSATSVGVERMFSKVRRVFSRLRL